MKNAVAQVLVGLPVEGPFDYSVSKELQEKIMVGQRVKIFFNRQKRIGYVVALKEKSEFKSLNVIIDILDDNPALDEAALKLTEMFAQHYGCSLGEAIETYLPAVLRTFKKTSLPQTATKFLQDKQPASIVIHDYGINKRWDELRKIISDNVNAGRSVIFLVPEKSYIEMVSKQLEDFKDRICQLKEKAGIDEELARWHQLKTESPFIVVGTRRAVFTPAKNLGGIIIYEEENYGYRQDQSPNYHVNDVALMRQRVEGADVIFVGSAPSAEIWKMSQSQKWQVKILEDKLTPVQVIDMGNYNPKRSSIVSFPLQNFLQQALENKKKAVLFMNRRGFSTMTKCNQCGYTVRCPRCAVALAYMYSKKKLACRHCAHEESLPKICPQCSGSYLRSMGTGIEKLESDIARFYPQAVIAHFDRETKAAPLKADVVIATQAIIKLRGRLQADIVAVLDFDGEFSHIDFRSGHKAFALLVHLAQMANEKLVIQTHQRDNYCLKAASTWDFKKFYQEELKLRKELVYPPYAHFLAVMLRGKKEEAVLAQSGSLYELMKKNAAATIEVSEPTVDFMPKLRDQYRYTIMLKGKNLKLLIDIAKRSIKEFKKRSVIITLNVDP